MDCLGSPQRVRLLVFLSRMPSLSLDDFWSYWMDTHRKIVTSIPVAQEKLTRYEQAPVNMVMNSYIRSLGSRVSTPANSEWDGVAIFEAKSYEDIFGVFQDSEYQRRVFESEQKFVDKSKTTMLPLDLPLDLGQK